MLVRATSQRKKNLRNYILSLFQQSSALFSTKTSVAAMKKLILQRVEQQAGLRLAIRNRECPTDYSAYELFSDNDNLSHNAGENLLPADFGNYGLLECEVYRLPKDFSQGFLFWF